MKRRDMMTSLIAGVVLPGGLLAQTDGQDSEAFMRQQMVLNGYSDSSRVIEMQLGFDTAPVTLALYASFTCPHCANFHNGPLAQLRRDYVATGKVRIVYRDVFVDRPGLWASMLARCTGPDRFFDAADLLYHNQSVWSGAEIPETLGYFSEIGVRAGMTDADLEACYENTGLAENLVAWSDKNRRVDNVTSTPTLIIDGVKHPNMGYADLVDVVEGALAKKGQ